MYIHGQPSTRFDYAVSVDGPLVKEINRSARRVWSRVAWTRWRSGLVWGKERHVLSIKPKGNMRAAFLLRNNIRHRRDIEDAYLQAIDQARYEIILASAYFLPELKYSLEQAVKMGADNKNAAGELAQLRFGAIFDRNRGVCSMKKQGPLKPIEKAA
jgi:phosphatidylserine/phosphatidylglycerophosphate/cardiolipin synthase-like enzyme